MSTIPKRYQRAPFDRTTFLPTSHTGTAAKSGFAIGTLGGAGFKVQRAKTAADARRIGGGLPKVAKPKPSTSPSALYGTRPPSGSPSAFYGSSNTAAPAMPTATPVAKPAPRTPTVAPAAPAPNPFAPLTDAQIQSQASSQVQAQIAPILKQIADSISARTQSGSDAILGLSKYFAPQIAAIQGIGTAGLATGVQGQAAIDNALYQALSGAGGAAASELGGKLAQINAPQQAEQTGAQSAVGQGSANANLATGSAALSALQSRLATAQDVAAKVPGLAPLFGLQATRQLEGQAQRDLADQQGRVTSQVPGLIQSILGNLRSNELSKAQEAERIREFGVSQANSDRAFNANQAADAASLAERRREFGVSQTNATANALTAGQARVAAAKIAAASRGAGKPFTLSAGQVKYIPNGKGGYATIEGPAKATASARPFTIRPGDTVEVPDGKGGYKGYTAPPAPKDPKAPTTRSTPTGTIQWNPTTQTWEKIPGTQPAAKQPSASDAKGGLAALATAGGVNWKTGALTPTFRKAAREYITRTTGTDPGPIPQTATPDQLARLQKEFGITPPAPKAKPRPRAPKITGTSPTSRFVVTYNPDGSVKSKEPNPNYAPPAAKAAGKSKASAIKTANQTALRIAQGGSKKTGVYTSQPKTDPFGRVVTGLDGKPVLARTRTGDRYSASYYETIHRIENAVEDQLSPYMSRSEIIRFAQRYANEYYPAGSTDRPRTAVQAEKATPAPKAKFPTRLGPTKPPKPKLPKNPRRVFAQAFPLGAAG